MKQPAKAPAPPLPKIVKAAPLELSRGMSAGQGFQAIIANCLAQIRANEDGVVRGDDPENIHQMRVGLRRLRSACTLFKDRIELAPALRKETAWLARRLGAARDWEVLAGTTLAQAAVGATHDSGMERVCRAAAAHAREQRARAASAVSSPRYAHLMRGLAAWAQAACAGENMKLPSREKLEAPLKRFADRMLLRSRRRLRKRGGNLHDGDTQARHQVRIAAKKTRYATEFFASLYPARRVRRHIESLAALQDKLGAMNDAVLAGKLLRELGRSRPELAVGIGYALGYLACATRQEERTLEKCWKQYKAVKPPCRNAGKR